jgi:prevent-host-death family protein
MAEREKKPMITAIPATQARRNFGGVIKRVYSGQERVRIEKDGLPVAWILGDAEVQRLDRLGALAEFEELSKAIGQELQAKGVTEEQGLAQLEKTQRQVFEEQYGHKLKKARRRKTS